MNYEEEMYKELKEISDGYYAEKAAEKRKQRRKIIARIIFSVLFYLAGMVLFIFGIADQLLQMIIVGALLCGIFTGISSVKTVEGGFWMKALFFVIGVAFGLIATPIRVIIDIINLITGNI